MTMPARWTEVSAAKAMKLMQPLLRQRAFCGDYITPYELCCLHAGHAAAHGRRAA